MNIIFIEDDSRLVDIKEPLKNKNHNVIYCKNMSAVMQCIEDTNIRSQVDVIVLDLSMDAIGLPSELREEAAKIGLAGWVFYDKILRDYNEGLCEKTIFYTGFGKRLLEKKIISQDKYDVLSIIHKQGGSSADKLLDELALLEKKLK